MTSRRRLLVPVLALPLLIGPAVAISGNGAEALTYATLKPMQKRLLSGTASIELDPAAPALGARAAAAGTRFARSTTSAACTARLGSNVKVNQNCLNLTDPDLAGRGQSQNETSMAADPNNPAHLIGSYNDYRRGDGTCGVSYSLDGGRSWADSTVPNGFTRGDFVGKPREYWQGGGDTSVAWDTRGNAYLSCQQFNRGAGTSPDVDQSSAFYVYRSTGTDGASWNFTGRPVATIDDTAGSGSSLLDKQLLTVDASTSSRFRDRVYVSWTTFAADGTAYIYAAHSADYGETFSAPVLVSRDSDLCPTTFDLPTPNGRCNENQFSQPFTAPDGTLYVTWANFNNTVSHGIPGEDLLAAPADNRNQMLIARSVDGGATFSAPVKVGDYYELPDCATYQQGQDPGRACVPEKGGTANSVFRATNYPSGAVNPKTGAVVVTFGSYINRHSNEANGCVPTGFSQFGINTYDGVKTAGACNNDILISASTNRGASFTGTATDPRKLATVTEARGQRTSDQFWQWVAFTRSGKLAVSYYDRQYGTDELTGYSDFSVSSASTLPAITVRRASSSSSPPPTQFAGTFWGDYTGLAVTGSTAYPFWSDTRAPALFLCPGTGTVGHPPAVCTQTFPNGVGNDQDAFTAAVGLG
jgi:hypothetical protein